ncbi:MAG: PEP-CTERM sorting domain-containing protein [Deltaproteobacteria bacterium]|nr:PEP-CTERM sorting domain-containing protein [Deltaproteobacteria bacterium]
MKPGIGIVLVVLGVFGSPCKSSAEFLEVLPGSHYRLWLGGTNNDAGQRGWGHVPVTHGGIEVVSITLPLKVGAIIEGSFTSWSNYNLNIPAGLLSVSSATVPVGSDFAVVNVRNGSGTFGYQSPYSGYDIYQYSTQSMLLGFVGAAGAFGGPIPLTGSIQFGAVNVKLGTDFTGTVNALSWRTGLATARVGFWDTAGGALYWPETETQYGSLSIVRGTSESPDSTAIQSVTITLVQPALFMADEVTQLNSFSALTLKLAPVPEPTSTPLIGLGALGLLALWRMKAGFIRRP